MREIFVHECGGTLSNLTTKINIDEPIDFALVVGDKSYRIQADKDNNLYVSLINGVNVEFVSQKGYPTIKLTQRIIDPKDWYDHLKYK